MQKYETNSMRYTQGFPELLAPLKKNVELRKLCFELKDRDHVIHFGTFQSYFFNKTLASYLLAAL